MTEELEDWQKPALTTLGKPVPTESAQLTPEEYKLLERKTKWQEGDE